jgi:tRNA(Ile)-lysidine synthase
MASSRKSSRSNPPIDPPLAVRGGDPRGVAARVAAGIGDVLRPSARLVVGLSGGVDSVALLDCLHELSRKRRFRLAALHVNHQLSPNAARWVAFCRGLCRARGVPFQSVKVSVSRGAELEAAARAARYEVFARQDCDGIVLAHHRDDQVETLLLQLLRGAGVKGLAGMPLMRKSKVESRKSKVPQPDILRPLLDATREEILAYARSRGLKWVEDESNSDTRFGRNFLRHEILPAIARRFPSYRVTLARSAGHLAEASRLLDEVAEKDGADGLDNGTLAVRTLRRLPPARARNLLRYFLAERGVNAPGAARLGEALRQALAAKQDARMAIELGGVARLMRYGNRLHVVHAGPVPRYSAKRWKGEARVALPEAGGILAFKRTKGRGIGLARLRGRSVTIGLRRGGERLQLDFTRPRRSLKNLLQEAKMPPWQRERLPMLYCGEDLVWVPGIGTACKFRAVAGEASVVPQWNWA